MKRNIEALKQLRRVVEAAPDDLLHMRAIVEQTSCGTARCAIGWAAVDPWFQRNTMISDIIPANYSSRGLRQFGPHGDMARIGMIFGLSLDESDLLFAGDLSSVSDPHDVSKAEVLWNIDALMGGREPLPYEAAAGDEFDVVPRPAP